MSTARPAPLAPAGSGERLIHIDIIRGFTLLGVLLSNIQYWFRAPRGHQNLSFTAWPGFGNDAASWLIRGLVEMKSLFLLSMLFGVGLAIQMEHAQGRSAGFGGFAVRRLLALMGIGLLHILLVWNGDILLIYGFLGLLSLLLIHRKPGTLRIWVFGLWTLACVLILLGPLKTLLGPPHDPMTLEAIRANDAGELRFQAYLTRHYLETSWLAVAQFRVMDFCTRILPDESGSLFVLFTNMLTGFVLWKSGLLKDPGAHLPALKRFVRWALPLGVGLHAIYASKFALRFWGYGLPWSTRRFIPLAVDLSMILGAIAFSLGLGAAILVLTQDERWKRRLAPLATLGRMTLSTYLTQSVVMTAIFYGWGLGYYNRMSPLAGAVLGVAFFALQILVSVWWMRRFRFGPVEWLWRCITYAKVQPLRLARHASRPAEPAMGTE